MTLVAQYEATRQALLRAKPKSKRSTYLHRDLVHIQCRRMRQEMKMRRK